MKQRKIRPAQTEVFPYSRKDQRLPVHSILEEIRLNCKDSKPVPERRRNQENSF